MLRSTPQTEQVKMLVVAADVSRQSRATADTNKNRNDQNIVIEVERRTLQTPFVKKTSRSDTAHELDLEKNGFACEIKSGTFTNKT